jgi:hypothetical protein
MLISTSLYFTREGNSTLQFKQGSFIMLPCLIHPRLPYLQASTCPEEKKNKRSTTYPTMIFVFFYKTTEAHILKINFFRQYYSLKSSIQQWFSELVLIRFNKT